MSGWELQDDRKNPGGGNGAGGKEPLFTIKDPGSTSTNKDDPETSRRHTEMLERLADEQSRQAENRYQMAVDEDYYDSMQWTPDDAAALMERGQAPLVFNKIKPTINWITGTEKRTRIDYNVLPREESDEKGAEAKKKLLKYVCDVNNLQFHRSQSFRDAVVAGLGWLEEGINPNPEEELISCNGESWKNVFQDSRSRELDYRDGRYQIRSKVIDLDMAQALLPHAKEAIENSTLSGFQNAADSESVWYLGERLVNQRDFDSAGYISGAGTFGQRGAFVASSRADVGRRAQVRINEGWYTVPVPAQYFATGDFKGQVFDKSNDEHKFQVKKYSPGLINAVVKQMRVMLFTDWAALWDGPSPYTHKKFPLTPIWCYRRSRDGMPYGVVRDIRDPQEDLNKRRSKALFILSANRIVMTKGAVDDIEGLREEAARPDAIIETNTGKVLKFEKPSGEFQQNMELAQDDANFIQEVSGVTSENLGHSTNATSGKAILARQDQGSTVTANLFDCLRFSVQQQGEKLLALIEQYYSEAKVVRIVGNKQPIEWLPINKVDPDTGKVLNDITASKSDFIVSEQDFRASLRQAAQEQMTELVNKLPPEVALQVLDLVVDLWEIPEKEQWLQRIRKINGQHDPAQKPTPEEQQALAKQQAQQDQVVQLKTEDLAAEVAVKKATAEKMSAEAQVALATLNAPQANPELQSAQEQLTALTQQIADIKAECDRNIFDVKTKGDERVRAVETQLDAERLKALDRQAEFDSKIKSEERRAEIQKDTAIEVARVNNEGAKALDGVMQKIADLGKQIADIGKEHGKTVQEHGKNVAAVETSTGQALAKLEKTVEKVAADTAKAIEKVQTAQMDMFTGLQKSLAEDKKADKADKAEKDDKPAQPQIFNIDTGGGTKTIVIEKGKDGTMKGTVTQAKPDSKKPT